jgi:ABC-type transport system substrate-binding protein
MIKRLRPKWSDAKLKKIYATPHDHTAWQDHILRVNKTLEIAQSIDGVKSAADLSAGDASIIIALGLSETYIGDYAPRYEYTGPIEQTIEQIPDVDLYICSETLEHLDNPIAVLKQIRAKTKYLLLTTPHAKFNDVNEEHYWAWDKDGIAELLAEAGFETVSFELLELENDYYYDYQIWVCK